MRSADRYPLPIWPGFAASRRAAPTPFADGRSAAPAGRRPNCCASSPWRAIVTRSSKISTSSIGSISRKTRDRRAGKSSARKCATRFAAASTRLSEGVPPSPLSTILNATQAYRGLVLRAVASCGTIARGWSECEGWAMSKPDAGFDYDRYRKLLAEATDEPKRLALIDLLVDKKAQDSLALQSLRVRLAGLGLTRSGEAQD